LREGGFNSPRPLHQEKKPMNFGFYGHSAACWAEFPIYGKTSFIDKIIDHYDAKLVNKGVPQGSEERILYDLKKTKKIDLAVIFHSQASKIFIPRTSRDLDLNDVDRKKIFYLWKSNPNESDLLAIKNDYFAYGHFKETFEDINIFMDTVYLYKKYLYDPDLILNRFYGSLIQIDQYLLTKNIPAIHIYKSQKMPTWFKFTSGITAEGIEKICEDYYEIGLPNNINELGQEKIYQCFVNIIDHYINPNNEI
jgi:hypothetical protein